MRLATLLPALLASAHGAVQGLPKATPKTATPKTATPKTAPLPTGLRGTVVPTRPPVVSPELDPWREYEVLRGGLDQKAYREFFARRPARVAGRFAEVATTLRAAKADWDSAAGEGLAAGEKSDEFDPTKDVRDEEASREDRGGRLCEALSSLGPISVKISQTLSQRPDIVGDEAATALKRLQTANVAFEDRLAWAVVKESLKWRGPIAPGVGVGGDDEPDVPPLFASISDGPVAVASLGQVYKATTHEGEEVAVKVQRPDAMAVLAKDYVCFTLAWGGIEAVWKAVGDFDNGDVASVVDRVAADVLDELDYELEAANAERFEESLSFLGFVTTPVVLPRYSSKRVLVTEWVRGHHLSALDVDEGLRMTRMAVEACTASLVLTGYVHADPHEGNLMLDEEGRLCFLDFGLMSSVSEGVMEAFARGIQACLSEDWTALATAFRDTGFVTDPIEHCDREAGGSKFEPFGVDPATGEDLGLAKLSEELGVAMAETEDGTSRFGALATVLNQKLAPRWKMFTPPYVLLLIRTFLTLEGIAARVDPDFNIYETAMPWAVRRSLSPSSAAGIATLRDTLLTPDRRVQWDRLLELAEGDGVSGAEGDGGGASTAKQRENDAAKKEAMNAAVGSLIGSPSGSALRRALHDLDTTDLAARLVSKEGRALRHAAALAVCGAISPPWKSRLATSDAGAPDAVTKGLAGGNERAAPAATAARPVSESARLLRQRQERWKRKVALLLLQTHLSRQLQRGRQGALALASFAWLSLRVVAGAARQTALRALRAPFRGGGGEEGEGAPTVALA